MKKLIKKLEDLMVAVTFAEAGEYDEANKQSGNTLGSEEELQQSTEGIKKTALENAGKQLFLVCARSDSEGPAGAQELAQIFLTEKKHYKDRSN